MIKILYGFILLTSLSLIACSSTEEAVDQSVTSNEYWQSANVITFVSYITTEFEINNPVLPQE